jgi:hypothetical protein
MDIMAYSYSALETTANLADADVRQIPAAEFSVRDGGFVPRPGVAGRVYVNTTTIGNNETTVLVTLREAPREMSIGVRHTEITLTIPIQVIDDVTGFVLAVYPMRARLLLDLPMTPALTETNLSYMVQNLFGVFFPTVAAGVLSTVNCGKILSGVVSIL